MTVKKSGLLAVAGICMVVSGLVVTQTVFGRNEDPKCDITAVIQHQEEHAQELANFAEEAKDDLDAALATLYRTAIAYQALAVECGFSSGMAVQAAHELKHASFNTDTDTDTDHTETDGHTETDAHAHDPAAEAQTLALAQSVGDPEQGKILFNTVRPEVSFACATCHRVDSTETLVGPGLLGIAGHAHNHGAAAGDSMAGMDMGAATATPDTTGGHSHDHAATATPDGMAGMNMGAATATPDSIAGMNMGEATPEATAAPERTLAETVEFLHTSIVNPSAYVMPGFPDNLMPKVYGTIFTETELNNIIAYLLTLD
jgi:cytochrome c2